jgi:hypothetical protein
MEGFGMKTDAQLKKDVMEELRWEPSVTASDINVAIRTNELQVWFLVEHIQ